LKTTTPGIFLILLGLLNTTAVSAFTDTTQKKIHLASKKAGRTAIVLKEANVIYPDNLESEKDRSISYVEKFSESRRGYLQRT